MRHVERSSVEPPQFFLGGDVARLRQDQASHFSYGSDMRSQRRVETGRGYIEKGISSDLRDLFLGKCAYCEQHASSARPYAFRPPTEAEPVRDRSTSHLYYMWLSLSWDNWLWVCADCWPDRESWFGVEGKRAELPSAEMMEAFALPDETFTQGLLQTFPNLERGQSFLRPSWPDFGPVSDSRKKESNLLLDPTEDRRLWRSLGVAQNGAIFPISKRGVETISHFKLDRDELRSIRSGIIADLEGTLQSFAERNEKLTGTEEIFDVALPFAGCLQLRLRFIVAEMARLAGENVRLEWSRIFGSFNSLVLQYSPSLLERALESDQQDQDRKSARFQVKRSRKREDARTSLRISQIDIKNFKSIESLSFEIPKTREVLDDGEPSAGSLLILGENATGKSTILEATALCASQADLWNKVGIEPASLVLDPSFMDAASKVEAPGEASVILKLEDGSERALYVSRGGVEPDYAPSPLPVFAYGAFRQYIKQAHKRLPAHHNIATLLRSDYLLPNPEPWLAGLDEGKFDEVARALKSIFAVEGEYDVIQREEDRCFIATQYDHDGKVRTERTPIGMVSSGFRAVLAMTCDIMRGLLDRKGEALLNARALVLIDEIEAHLHPRWKIAIMSALREALPQVTFLVTSHDPLCLRGMSTSEVMVLNRVRGETRPGSDLPVYIESLTALPNIEELTIEQLLTADFFQLNSTDSLRVEREYARIADELRRRKSGEAESDKRGLAPTPETLNRFEKEIANALPIGDTEVQRIVQEAVAEYLQQRERLATHERKELRERTKMRIRSALEGI